jgi:hypothetical protein
VLETPQARTTQSEIAAAVARLPSRDHHEAERERLWAA